MTKKLDLPLILLAIAGFLAPLIGGQVAVDSLALSPGSNAFLTAVQGASETPTLSHALLAILCSTALAILLLRKQVTQVPNATLGGVIAVLLSLIVSTIGVSAYRSVSIPAGIEWVTYGICFYAVVASVGRQEGPKVLLGAIFAGCIVLAILGIREYGDMKAIDPTWRIFAQWVGPNAMAAVLMVGFLLGVGLAINQERLGSLGLCLGCLVIGLALFLTQSKGSLLALAISVIVMSGMLWLWLPKPDRVRGIGIAVGTLSAVALLALAISLQPKSTGPAAAGVAQLSPGARIVNVGGSADQSVGFRKLLWQSAMQLTKQNPMGSGIGTFQFESARPGLTTQTHFAHNAYLQLAAEASPLATILLVAGLLLWTRLIFRGGSKLRSSQNVLRAAVFASVLAIAGHSLIDSDFSYYGIGIVVFMLLGVGLLLSSDAVSPEFLPLVFRRTAAIGIVCFTALLGFLGNVEASRAEARGALSSKDAQSAVTLLESLRSTAPWDADVWYLSVQSTADPSLKLTYARKTVELSPTTRNLRLLAKLESTSGNSTAALEAMQQAEVKDPNNTQSLTLLAQIQRQIGEPDRAKDTLKRLVGVEQTPYFKVRSLPEMVVTDTYDARVELAADIVDPKQKIELLQPAIDGYRQFLSLTVPNIIRFAKSSDGPLPYGGETIQSAQIKLQRAAAAAKDLANTYRVIGDGGKATVADGDAEAFSKPLEVPADGAPAGKDLALPSLK